MDMPNSTAEDGALTAALAGEIRAEMARQGVTHRDLATATGIAPRTLTDRLAGRGAFPLRDAAAIAAALHVRLTDLLARAEGVAA